MEEELIKTNSEREFNTLNLKITNYNNFKPVIRVDGKNLKFKRDNFGSLVTAYQTKQPTVTIEFKKLYDINGPMWFLTSLFFFVISIFGIFDLKPNKRCISIVSTIKVKVNKSCNLKIALKSRTQLEKAFELEPTDCEIVEETGNNYFIDETAKKRYKIMRAVKVFLWLALIAVVVLLLFKKFEII